MAAAFGGGLWLFSKVTEWLIPSTRHSNEDPFRRPPF